MCLSTSGSSIGNSRFLKTEKALSVSQLCTWDPWLWQIFEQGEVIHSYTGSQCNWSSSWAFALEVDFFPLTLPLGLNSVDGTWYSSSSRAGSMAQNESDRPKSRQLTTASIQASVQMDRETSAAIQSQTEMRSWTWQTESEAAPPQKERLSLEASLRMLQANECDQPGLCSQQDVMLPCPCQMHSLPCLDQSSVCLHWIYSLALLTSETKSCVH